jgi:hypothetical protein
VIDRRCPECENRDRVLANRLAAEVWYRCNAAIAQELEALADSLANGLAVVSDVCGIADTRRAGR